MARYKADATWDAEERFGNYVTQSTDATDTKNGQVYREGAWRVCDGRTGKPVTGKGGTTPFFGESAWSDAQRLASDLHFKEQYGR